MHMHSHLPRVLGLISTLVTRKGRENTKKIFLELQSVKGEVCSMRFLVPNLERLIAAPNFFIIGFFGFKMENSSVTKQIWDLDDKLVAAIPNFEGILAYH